MLNVDKPGGITKLIEAGEIEDALVEGGEELFEVAARRETARQREEAAKPIDLKANEVDDVEPVVAVADEGAEGDDDEVDQLMRGAADDK